MSGKHWSNTQQNRKLNEDIVREIREMDEKEDLFHSEIAAYILDKYGIEVTNDHISNIISRRVWKKV